MFIYTWRTPLQKHRATKCEILLLFSSEQCIQAQILGTNMAPVRAELWRHSTAQADRVNRLDGQTLLIDGSGFSNVDLKVISAAAKFRQNYSITVKMHVWV